MDYTEQNLDRACHHILEGAGIPTRNVEAMRENLSRPVLCKHAAEEAFRKDFPSSTPSLVIRIACDLLRRGLNDLNEHGSFRFEE